MLLRSSIRRLSATCKKRGHGGLFLSSTQKDRKVIQIFTRAGMSWYSLDQELGVRTVH